MKIGFESNVLKRLLENCYFLNGTAYAGKSTMVRLLAEKHDGICCGENYHDEMMHLIDPVHQPNLSYISTMPSWQTFVTRTPEEYTAWMDGCAREAAELELLRLIQLASLGKKIFVDTNIGVDMLHAIARPDHVAIMLSPQNMSVDRFFDRQDAEKQFIYQQLLRCPDPEAALANYRNVLHMVNSRERYDAFARSGFFTHVRTEQSTIEGTLAILEEHFGLDA